MLNDFIYKSNQSKKSNTTVIVLPEIFGLTDFICKTTDDFAKQFGVSAYGLDFFYQLNNTPNKFDYDTEMQKGIELMQQMRGEDFVEIFSTALGEISQDGASIENIIVCGFCFGGRLAYVAGSDPKVSKVISYYGAGAHTPDFINGRTPIENLAQAKTGDSSFSVLSFYGQKDDSIPDVDRVKTSELLKQANINYEAVVYPQAGHGFFNSERATMYNQPAANDSWQRVISFVGKSLDLNTN